MKKADRKRPWVWETKESEKEETNEDCNESKKEFMFDADNYEPDDDVVFDATGVAHKK